MTTTGRGATLVALAIAVLIGLTAPANAAFTARATMATATVGTVSVVPPTKLSTAGTKCETHVDSYGRTYTTLEAKLSWTPSTTEQVTSYRVVAYASGWSYEVTSVDGSATSVRGSYDSYYATQNIQVVVTARTSYGWTAESVRSPVIRC
jgi:hypothetical protein